MGRTLARKKIRRPKRQHRKGSQSAEGTSFTEDSGDVAQKSEDVKFIDKLMDKAESLIDCFEYETAQKFCQRALDLEPNNLRVLETSSGLMLDVGEAEAALQCLEKAVQLSPDSGHTKFLTLGQIYTGLQAVDSYQKGIKIMADTLTKKSSEASSEASEPRYNQLRKDLSCAYCSVAEIYMSDCCFEENAKDECKLHIDKAIETDESNPEVYLCLANFLMVEQNNEEAISAVKKSLSLWLPKYQDIREGKLDSSEFDVVEVCSLSYDSRINTSKLLIELELYNEAVEVLEGLAEENDEVVEVWHLLGWTNYLHGSDYKGNARFYLAKATEVAKKVEFDDEDLLKHIEELMEELGPDEENDEEENEEGDEWEDISEDEMEA